MIWHVVYRLFVAVLRLVVLGFALLGLMELTYCLLGDSDRHVWLWDSYTPSSNPPETSLFPNDLIRTKAAWLALLQDRCLVSGRVLLLALLAIYTTGFSWGVLGARLRRFHVARFLSLPFSALACVPGFCFVVIVAVGSYFYWQRPGFADDLIIANGPDILTWWNAAIVALPMAVGGIAWHIRAVATDLEREARQPWLRGFLIEGENDETCFYRRILARRIGALIQVSSTIVPSCLGALIILEPAFRMKGVGSLLVESIRAASYPGIFLSSLTFLVISVAASLMGEVFHTEP